MSIRFSSVPADTFLLLLLLALQLFVSFGLLNSSLPRFSIHNHPIPILNLHFSHTRSDIILPSIYQSFLLQLVSTVTLLTVLSLSVLTIYPTRLILCAFIYLTTSACLISKSISLLVLILQLPSWFFIEPYILPSYQTLLIVVQVRLLVPRFRIHTWLLVLSDFYRCALLIPSYINVNILPLVPANKRRDILFTHSLVELKYNVMFLFLGTRRQGV